MIALPSILRFLYLQVVLHYLADEENTWDNVVVSIRAPSDSFSLAFSSAGGDTQSCGLLLDDIKVVVLASGEYDSF